MSFCAVQAPAKVEAKQGVTNGKGRGEGDRRVEQADGEESSKQKHKSLESDSDGEGGKEGAAKKGGGAGGQDEGESMTTKKKGVDEHVRKICKHLPEGGLAIVLGTSGDLSDVTHLRLRRRNAAGNV